MSDKQYDLMDYDELEPEEFEENNEIEYLLTSYGIDFDVSGLVRRVNSEAIYAPEFQRNYVWNLRKASKFIESLLLGLPVPGIFLLKEESSQKFLVIDGLQRLTSLANFYNNNFQDKEFKLTGVCKAFENKTIHTIEPESRLKLDDTILHATIIKPDDPKEKNFESIYLIFERLNTGGMNLSPQEIRNCIYQGDLLNIVIELGNDNGFLEILKIDKKRKKHEEICLRLIALTLNSENYTGNMKVFLNEFLEKNREMTEEEQNFFRTLFKSTMDIIVDQIGPELFRLKNGPINLAVLDGVFVGLSKMIIEGKSIRIEDLRGFLNDLIKSNAFQDTIQTGRTHHTDSVKRRIDLIYTSLKKC